MRRDAISALVTHANGYIDQLFGQSVDGAWRHDLLAVFPGTLQGCGIVRQSLPEIIDPISFAGRHNVVINRPHLGAGIVVFNESKR